MSAIIIEQAKIQDLDSLYYIERECFTYEAYTKEQILTLLKSLNIIGFVAKINGEIAGFIIGQIENFGVAKVGYVHTIDVALKNRRSGIGQRLLEELERTLFNKGATICYLEVRIDNKAGLELYRKQGYIELESVKDYYYKGIHGIRLKKELTFQ
jgi:ribosomal-protein-alanine N-acetyltransferase